MNLQLFVEVTEIVEVLTDLMVLQTTRLLITDDDLPECLLDSQLFELMIRHVRW